MIVFEGVTKRYGGVLALSDLTLSVGPGEIVALLGPNGSGKSTTLKAAVGLIRPTAGRVLIDGADAARAASRRRVAYLPQRAAFAESLTGFEVVEFYRKLRGAPAERTPEVLRVAALNGAGGRAVGTYSGGMLQRLALAVAAVSDAPMLLLDEPTASLDPEGLAAFYALAERRRGAGGTVLFSSHQLGDAERLADRFAILVGGRLVAVLGRDELARRLASRGTLRLRVDGEELSVRATAEERPAVLERLRRDGRVVQSIAAEEGRLDDLYADLIGTEGEKP
ncbi:MAG TPA: ABC transporter ATP-binding protein [Thermoanaerobaculia bacterium]